MNTLIRLHFREFSRLSKAAYGFDTRLNSNAQTLIRSSDFQLIRPFHVTSFLSEVSEKAKRRRERLLLDPSRNRTQPISVETSIKYLQSEAYKEGYGDEPVWKHYRRNHKGQIPPKKTRKMCIRNGVVSSSNPCPICRDEYLVVDYRNLDLLKQFISPYNGELISYEKTGVCQQQYQNLLVAFLQAKELGLITFDLPFREYNYSEYELK